MAKIVFAVLIFAAGATGAAWAADLKAPPPAPPGWAGSYGGVSGGYGWGHSDQTDPGIPVFPTINQIPQDGHYSVRGGLLGGTLGYNFQQGPWVYGLEGDFSWADIKGQSSVCGPASATPHPCGTKLDALGTFRGRVGYVTGADRSWLLYATGGLAVGDIRAWDTLTPAFGNDWRAGWTVGAGVEKAFAPNWTAKLEYLHVDLGNPQVFNVAPGVPESVSFRADILRASINYRFGGPAAAPELYTKAPYAKAPPMAASNGWSGWYAGLNAGYLDGSRNISADGVVTNNSTTPGTAPAMASGATGRLSTGNRGVIGGAQFGYNHMVSPMFLAGVEADIQGSSLRGNAGLANSVIVDTLGGPGSFQTAIATSRGLDYIGTIRGRLGAVVTPTALLYVTGGLAFGGVKSSTSLLLTSAVGGVLPTATSGTFSDTRAGYAVGGGGEWMLMSKWSVKAEYLYYDLGAAHYGTGGLAVDEGPTQLPGIGVAAIGTTSHVRFNGNIARVGLNYHLN
jgi:outer membrane immunogenic protein